MIPTTTTTTTTTTALATELPEGPDPRDAAHLCDHVLSRSYRPDSPDAERLAAKLDAHVRALLPRVEALEPIEAGARALTALSHAHQLLASDRDGNAAFGTWTHARCLARTARAFIDTLEATDDLEDTADPARGRESRRV
ncbi:DUF6415 family natural product biosynthesis protein [Streptomyces sp. NPDC002851]